MKSPCKRRAFLLSEIVNVKLEELSGLLSVKDDTLLKRLDDLLSNQAIKIRHLY